MLEESLEESLKYLTGTVEATRNQMYLAPRLASRQLPSLYLSCTMHLRGGAFCVLPSASVCTLHSALCGATACTRASPPLPTTSTLLYLFLHLFSLLHHCNNFTFSPSILCTPCGDVWPPQPTRSFFPVVLHSSVFRAGFPPFVS